MIKNYNLFLINEGITISNDDIVDIIKSLESEDNKNSLLINRLVNHTDNKGKNVLMNIVQTNNEELIDYVLKFNVDINHKTKTGENVLFFCKNVKIFNKFYNLGADVTAKNKNKSNILTYLASKKIFNIELYQKLINDGVDINQFDDGGFSVLTESIMNKGYRTVCNIESDNNCYFYIWDSVTRKGSPVCCKIYRKEQIIKILVKQIKELNKFLDTKNLQEAGNSNKKLYVLKPIKDNMFLKKIKELYPENTSISYEETYDGYLFNRYDQELIRLLILHNQEYKLLKEEDLIENIVVIRDQLLLTKKGFAILSKNKEYFDKYIVLPVIKDFFVSQYQSKNTFIKDYDIYKDRETTESINYTIGIKIPSISKIENEDQIVKEVRKRCELLMKRQDLVFHKV